MFFLLIQCGDNGKQYYLPHVENWSGRLHIGRDVTGNESYDLSVTMLNGKASLELLEGFRWAENFDGNELKHLSRVVMEKPGVSLNIYVAKIDRKAVAMRKFVMPSHSLTIGSKGDNMIIFDEPPVSRSHASISRNRDGSAQFTDRSRNGSFVNGHFIKNTSCLLNYGDRVLILPSLVFIYLGDCFAVNHTDKATYHPSLKPVKPERVQENRVGGMVSVWSEYHRAPRHVQQPNEEIIEIDPPIEKERKKDLPTWLAIGPSFTMVLPMLMSTLVSQRSMGSSLVMIGTSSALAVMWGTFNRKYQQKQGIQTEEERQRVCKQYYAEMEERILAETEREHKRLMYKYLSVGECTGLPFSREHRLWERLVSHDDFLQLRLGLGEQELPVKLSVKPPKISLTDDPLRHEAKRLYDQYSVMSNVPITISMRENSIIGILGKRSNPWLMQSLVVQAAANHSYHDVRIAILYNDEDVSQWAFAKWLPHVFASDDRSMRMAVSDPNAIRDVLAHIDSVLTMRADMQRDTANEEEGEGNKGSILPWYLVFCTDPELMEDHPIMRYLTASNLGVTFVMQTDTMEQLPKECFAVVEAKERLGAVYTMEGKMTGVRFEATTEDRLHAFSRSIAPVRIKEVVENSAIPSIVTFLETYQARKVEDIDVRYFWNENHAWQSIRTTLGIKAGGVPFVLDISDKNHGPHGLIAGTTGAGKSVLLQTFILSLAINYSPTEVQFILIDYKGGGTSEDFRILPHAAGIIDSLQGERMIFRALASIKGEILRREEIFKRVGVNNIDDYMKYYNNDASEEPLGHLVIIVDEFAELKKEQPDFMRELVSAARVGRSLGMHLVLATQKPSNSVSDEIAANTRFRICLRVASKSDSSEMLKRPEAAYLKGMGRCYVQVGNDELFEQVQTSYSGAEYAPDALRPEEEPRILNESGQPIKLKRKKNVAKDDEMVQKQTELDKVLEHLNNTCDLYHFPKARNMWLDEMAMTLRMDQLEPLWENIYRDGQWKTADEGELLAYYAMADDVEKQRYLPVAMDLIGEKNQIICGLSGSGKTTVLQSIAVSLALRYSPDEVQMYIFSLTSRILSCLETLPHVGDIVYEEEADEQVRLMELIYQESEQRKKLFAQLSTDNFVQYNKAARASGGKTVPAIVVLIDRMAQLREWADQKKEDKLQLFYDMLRSANSQGIFFIMTAYERSELPGKYQSFVHGISLQMNDRMDYADALGARIPIEWGGIREYPGRGMIARVDKEAKQTNIYEIQVAMYGSAESDAGRSDQIRQLGNEMRAAWTGRKPRRINRIPEEPTLSLLLENEEMKEALARYDWLPLGYLKNSGQTYSLNLREQFSMLVCGPKKSGKTNFVQNIASMFATRKAQIHVIGSGDLVVWARQQGMKGYEHGDVAWTEAFTNLFVNEVPKRSAKLRAAKDEGGKAARDALLETMEPIIILIDDLDAFIEKYGETEEVVKNLRHFCADIVSGYGIYTFATLSHNGYQRTKIKEPVLSMARSGRGLMLQGKLSDCDPFDVSMPFNRKNVMYPLGEGLLVTDQDYQHMVIPRWN
ncbi:MAG: type VII secretion protein EssC [Clostridiales bacterium]|nr:type VII secretion protein EssC [Clostridiales bacterium]